MGDAYDCEHGSMSAEATRYTSGYWQTKALEYAQRLAEERAEIIRLRARLAELTQLAEYAKLDIERLRGAIRDPKDVKEIERLKLEIHRLERGKATEARCTREMRDSYQQELEALYGRLSRVREALGKEWDASHEDVAVAQLKKDHIASVQIADQVPELHHTIQKLNDEMTKLRETKDYALLTQLRDENRRLRETLDIATHGIEETVSRLKAHRD